MWHQNLRESVHSSQFSFPCAERRHSVRNKCTVIPLQFNAESSVVFFDGISKTFQISYYFHTESLKRSIEIRKIACSRVSQSRKNSAKTMKPEAALTFCVSYRCQALFFPERKSAKVVFLPFAGKTNAMFNLSNDYIPSCSAQQIVLE